MSELELLLLLLLKLKALKLKRWPRQWRLHGHFADAHVVVTSSTPATTSATAIGSARSLRSNALQHCLGKSNNEQLAKQTMSMSKACEDSGEQ